MSLRLKDIEYLQSLQRTGFLSLTQWDHQENSLPLSNTLIELLNLAQERLAQNEKKDPSDGEIV